MKRLLRAAFSSTLRDLQVRPWLAAAIDARLQAEARRRPILVLAFGKAARPMAQALVDLLPGASMRGLVVPPAPDDAPLPPFEVLPGGHPLPTAGSFAAASRALELAQSATADELVVHLVSGGGSALLERPADPRVTVDELRQLYAALVGSGADIAAINTVRRHLSAVKAGRLAVAARGAARQVTFAVADVPDRGNLFAALASGPSAPDDGTFADCRTVLDQYRLWPAVPPALRERLERGDLPPPLRPDDPLLQRCEFWRLLDERTARACMQRHLRAAGCLVVADPTTDDLPYRAAADHLLRRLAKLRRRHPGRRIAIVSSGELSVPLPADPGTGGRNLQFALHCAQRIRGQAITVLSAGTDGIDGNSPAAGAVVDGTTAAKARALGFPVADHLQRCDAYPLLDAVGATVATGPTGTNVRDLRVLLAHG